MDAFILVILITMGSGEDFKSFEISMNKAFNEVIRSCAIVNRTETWINKDIENLTFLIELYIELEMKTKAKNEIDLLRNQNVDPNIIDELLKKISS